MDNAPINTSQRFEEMRRQAAFGPPTGELIMTQIRFFEKVSLPEENQDPLLDFFEFIPSGKLDFNEQEKQALELTPIIQKMICNNLCNEVTNLLFLFQKFNRRKNYLKTSKATQARKNKFWGLINDLEPYLQKVEANWHPLHPEDGNKFRHSKNSRVQSVQKIFKEQKQEIISVFQKHNIKKQSDEEYHKSFAYYFEKYTRVSREKIGRSCTEYIYEKRKRRILKPRKNSSKKAKTSI